MLTRQIAMVFLIEAGHQCRALLRSADDLAQATARVKNIEDVMGDIDDIWRHIQGVLIASANVSKIFWGSAGKKTAEREPLRRVVGIGDDSPLHDPDLRNDFEHFDERLVDFYADSESMNFDGRNIGTMSEDLTNRFHHYNPQTGEVTFLGRALSLPILVTEAQWLADKLHPLNLINLWAAIDQEFPA